MKLACIIPSRGRPGKLAAVLHALRATQSPENEVVVAVSYCRGDDQTMAAAMSVEGVWAIQRPDNCTPGAAFNHAAAQIEADVYFGFCDDVFPLTWWWDKYMQHAIEQGVPCASWIEAGDPMNNSYLFATARYIKAIGKPCPEYFPCWFTDLWVAEINEFAFGHRPPQVQGLFLGGTRGTTMGLRDLAFWLAFFNFTRGERLMWASRLAIEYGIQQQNTAASIRRCAAWDADMMSKVPWFTERFSAKGEPEPYYVLAKQRAEAVLRSVEAAE